MDTLFRPRPGELCGSFVERFMAALKYLRMVELRSEEDTSSVLGLDLGSSWVVG